MDKALQENLGPFAWRLTEPDPFHEEMGFYLWDSRAKQVMRSLLTPL